MTARFITTLGALALGLAAFAITPALAQAGGGGNVPSGTPTTTNAGEGHPGPTGNATRPANPATAGHMGQSMMHSHRTEHHAAMHSKGHMGRATSANSGDEAVNRLNDQSLQAAQKGTAYMPGGMHQ